MEPNEHRLTRFDRWAERRVCLATILYVVLALPYALSRVGLQYDEALHQVGAADILQRGNDAGLGEPDNWIHLLGIPVKLMTVPYVGAAKDLLLLLPFRVFGTDPAVGRLVAVALAALGVYGIGRLVHDQLGPWIGGLCAFVLAVNPTYIDQTVFDKDPLAVTMGAIGLVALALNRMLRAPSKTNAFLLGSAGGILIWVRLNNVWLLASLAVAVVLVLGRRLLPVLRDQGQRFIRLGAVAAAGALVGAAPFIVYQLQSGWKSFAFDYLPTQSLTADLVRARVRAIPDTLLADAENRTIWRPGLPQGQLLRDGLIPIWQQAFIALVVLSAFALLIALRARGVQDARALLGSRIAGIAVVLLTVALVSTPYVLNEHHLVVLLPYVAVLCVSALVLAARLSPVGRWLGISALVLYLALAGFWNILAIRHLSETGGRGYWSGAVDCTARYVGLRDHGQLYQVLDWGLRTGVFVLNEGRPDLAETWVPELLSPELSIRGLSWDDDIRRGGSYLISAGGSRLFHAPGQNFTDALRRQVGSGSVAFVGVGFADERGNPASVAVDVFPPGTDLRVARSRAVRAASASEGGGCSTPVVFRDARHLAAFVRGGRA